MAVIGKIRNKGKMLLFIIGFSLVAFILGDFLSSNRGMFGGDRTSVAVIGGKKINAQDFDERVQTLIQNYKLNQNTETVDQNTSDQMREQAWNQLVSEEVIGTQIEKLGLKVSPEELFDMVKGKNPHPQIKQAFTDPKTGQFNPANVINFLKNMDNDATGKTKAQWVVFEKAIQEERLQQKYNDLIKQGLYVPLAEAKMEFDARNRSASIGFVMLSYNTINDTTVQVSDAELKEVYESNLKRYKQEATRSLDYVTFDVQPSAIDREAAMKDISKLAEDFKTAANDSTFAAINTDRKAEATYVKKGALPPSLDTVMFNSPTGTVVGPFEENGFYRLAKLSDSRMLPDSVKASHILLKFDMPDDQLMSRADSIKKAIEGGADFAMLSAKYSTDEGAKMKGGDLGWFGPGAMVKPFNDACFNAKKGEVIIVRTSFGLHIVAVNDMAGSSRQVKVEYIDRKIEASSKTYQLAYNKANEFAMKNNTAESFDNAVKSQNLTKQTEANIQESSRQVGPIENSRDLVRWAFTAKVGDVSKAYDFNNRFVIAKLTDIREKGYSTLEQVKDQVMLEARRNKKAQMLMDKISKTGKAGNINELAAALGQQVQNAPGVSFASPFLATGMEANVVGHVMAMKQGATSAPLKGMNGVYVVNVISFTTPPAPKDYKDTALQVRQQIQNRAQYEVFNALREKANIDDRRGKFY